MQPTLEHRRTNVRFKRRNWGENWTQTDANPKTLKQRNPIGGRGKVRTCEGKSRCSCRARGEQRCSWSGGHETKNKHDSTERNQNWWENERKPEIAGEMLSGRRLLLEGWVLPGMCGPFAYSCSSTSVFFFGISKLGAHLANSAGCKLL